MQTSLAGGTEEALLLYGLMFGALATLIGGVRLAVSYSILSYGATSRELYYVACLSWVVEIARDAQIASSGALGSLSESYVPPYLLPCS